MVYNGLSRFLRFSHTGNIPVLSRSLCVPSLYIKGWMGAAVRRHGANGKYRSDVCHCSEPRSSREVTWRFCAAARMTSLFIVFILESLQSQKAFGAQLVSCSAWIIRAPRAKHWQLKCQRLKYLAHKRRAEICWQTASLRNISDWRACSSGPGISVVSHWLLRILLF